MGQNSVRWQADVCVRVCYWTEEEHSEFKYTVYLETSSQSPCFVMFCWGCRVTSMALYGNDRPARCKEIYPKKNSNILQWRHNERHGVSNHRRLESLLHRLFRRKSKKTPTPFEWGNHRWTVNFPSERTSNTENVSSWWRHHYIYINALHK